MVIDKIENAVLYKTLSPGIGQALDYLMSNDFTLMDPGRYDIEGDNVFALVSEYETKESKDCKLEGHRKYLDVQFMALGNEAFEYVHFKGQNPIEAYDMEKDRAFYHTETSLIKFEEKCFAIFWADDLHRPCIMLSKPEKVKKVVIKVTL
jgi:YhcH/YjgK/YiaL family protein